MKILFIGDVAAAPGRKALAEHLPSLCAKIKPDSIIVNGENAAHGIGITPKIADEIFDMGVSCITGGDHSFDKSEIIPHMEKEPRIIRPVNYPVGAPGNGVYSYRDQNGKFVTVINAMGRVFMNALIDCPFKSMDKILENVKLGQGADAIIVDFHGEATSEMVCMGQYLDGRVSAVLGTHTHIPTADHRVLPKGTGFQSDVGMTGCYNSSIGMDFEAPLQAFVVGRRLTKMEPATGQGTICGALVDIDDKTGLATKVTPVRYGDDTSISVTH
ncbi:MAG: metallophosphoesterase [Alphaproteobacteria bacterium]|nr:MAG: metallophosphoesterase [Alphaproteobacteria bacterium]